MDEVRNAERKAEPARVVDAQGVEPYVLGLGGSVLLLLGGFFAWRELALANEVLMLAAALVASAIAWFTTKKQLPLLGPLVLVAATLSAGAWYAANKEPLLIVAMAMTLLMSVFATWYGQKAFPREKFQLHQTFSWLGMALNGLATTFATYFLVFNATENDLNDFVARRVLLTLTWLVSGALMVIWGRGKKAPEIRDAGFVVLAASMSKLLFYDMAHTDGMVRVATLLVGGAVLLGSSQLVAFLNRGKAVQ
ncbi:MAG: DUF2339 domain-containing protein [Myxococcaceae bacterium]|nr:DUF2339 domain-containing protein [Myxococcaceae bacterium]